MWRADGKHRKAGIEYNVIDKNWNNVTVVGYAKDCRTNFPTTLLIALVTYQHKHKTIIFKPK